jgi:hypothetical protein
VASTAVKVFGAEEAALHARRPLVCHRVQRGSQELQLTTTPSGTIDETKREREENHDSRQDMSDQKKERSHHHHHHQQIAKTHLHP